MFFPDSGSFVSKYFFLLDVSPFVSYETTESISLLLSEVKRRSMYNCREVVIIKIQLIIIFTLKELGFHEQ